MRWRDVITTPEDGPVTDSWPARHLSMANPRDDGHDDLPRLLRRLADRLEALAVDPMDVLDLTLSQEMTEDGPWWSFTLYWAPADEA